MEEFEMELTVKVKVVFRATKAEPRTWDYPGDPADIEVVGLEFMGVTVEDKLFNAIYDEYKDEIHDECWDYLGETAFVSAEYRRDAREDR